MIRDNPSVGLAFFKKRGIPMTYDRLQDLQYLAYKELISAKMKENENKHTE